jgi:hypothetical protein
MHSFGRDVNRGHDGVLGASRNQSDEPLALQQLDTSSQRITRVGKAENLTAQLQAMFDSRSMNKNRPFVFGEGDISSIHSDLISYSGLDFEAYGPHSEDDKITEASWKMAPSPSLTQSQSKKVSFCPNLVDQEQESPSSRETRLQAMRYEFRKLIAQKSRSQQVLQNLETSTPRKNISFAAEKITPRQQPSHTSSSSQLDRNCPAGTASPGSLLRSSCAAAWKPGSPSGLIEHRGNVPHTPRARTPSTPTKSTSSTTPRGRSPTSRPSTVDRPRKPRIPTAERRPASSSPAAVGGRGRGPAECALSSTLSSTLSARAAALRQRTDDAREALLRGMAAREAASLGSAGAYAGDWSL